MTFGKVFNLYKSCGVTQSMVTGGKGGGMGYVCDVINQPLNLKKHLPHFNLQP